MQIFLCQGKEKDMKMRFLPTTIFLLSMVYFLVLGAEIKKSKSKYTVVYVYIFN